MVGGQSDSVKSRSKRLAPQSGHVSNFCHPAGPVIEPMDDYRFDRDPCGPLTRTHGGHPVWTRLELVVGAASYGAGVPLRWTVSGPHQPTPALPCFSDPFAKACKSAINRVLGPANLHASLKVSVLGHQRFWVELPCIGVKGRKPPVAAFSGPRFWQPLNITDSTRPQRSDRQCRNDSTGLSGSPGLEGVGCSSVHRDHICLSVCGG